MKLGKDVYVGPYTIIEKNVLINNGTWIDAHAHIKPFTTIGKNCKIFHGAVLGEIPQDLKYKGEKSKVFITYPHRKPRILSKTTIHRQLSNMVINEPIIKIRLVRKTSLKTTYFNILYGARLGSFKSIKGLLEYLCRSKENHSQSKYHFCYMKI